MRNVKRFAILAAGALLLAGSPAVAEDGGRDFSLHLDELVVAIAEIDVDTASAKFSEYRDTSQGLLIPKLTLSGESKDHNRHLDARLARIGRDDARYTFDYGTAGRYELTVDYNRIPHRFGNDGRTLFSRTGPGRYEIADPVQGALQDAIAKQRAISPGSVNFAFLDGLLQPYLAAAARIDVGLQRDRTRADFRVADKKGFDWGVTYTHENRNGTRAIGSSFGFNNVTEQAEPIDYDTTGAEFKGEWYGAKGGVQFGYRYSKFENQIDTLIWDNPFRLTDSTDGSAYLSPSSSSIGGSSLGIIDLAPDNEAGSLFASGRARFGGHWTASGSVTYTTMTQDDRLQPYTLNTAIVGDNPFTGAVFNAADPSALPATSAGAKADALAIFGNLNGRFADRWSLNLRVRYNDYQNKSDHIEFPGYVRFHSVWEEVPRQTVQYAFTTTDLSAELGYELTKKSRLSLSWLNRSWDRDFREIKSSDEDILKLSWDTSWQVFDLRASYEVGDRSTSVYLTEAQEVTFVIPEGINNQPLLRKYDEAAREYDSWKLQAHWAASESVDLSFGVTGRNDDYTKSVFGLVSDDVLNYNAEVNWTLAEGRNFYLFYEISDREVFQRSRQSGGSLSTNPADSWQVTFDEKNDVAGIGVTLDGSSPWKFNANVTWSKSDGSADFFTPPGGSPSTAEGFGDYEDIELFNGAASLSYQVTKDLSAGLYYRYEDYTYDSFIVRNLDFYLPGALLLNANNSDFQANVYALYFRLKY
jgi:MtrB/PioB family decaheme-associated outer membrane protein